MTPATASAPARRAGRAASAPAHRRGRGAGSTAGSRRSALHLVPSPRSRAGRARRTSDRTRLLHLLAIAVVALALVAVVVGQALLASGQVRLTALQQELSLEQSANRQTQQTVAALETPARIVAAATQQLHMVDPSGVTELPHVSLSVPLPTPRVIGAPAQPASTATGRP